MPFVNRKRNDEESTCAEAFQRTSPQVTVAERDGAGDIWKMASEQRTEPRDCIYDTGSIWYSSAVKGCQGKAATGSACYSG